MRRSRPSRAPSVMYQDLGLALRVLRDCVQPRRSRKSASIRAKLSRKRRSSSQNCMPEMCRASGALYGRAADLRPVQRRGGDRSARSARRVDLKSRRLPDHRPDRGADDHRRQHRRLRRRAQLRRHDLQDQPRGRAAPSRASCACATWAASSSSTSSTWTTRSTSARCCAAAKSSWRATTPRSPSAASPSWAWWR